MASPPSRVPSLAVLATPPCSSGAHPPATDVAGPRSLKRQKLHDLTCGKKPVLGLTAANKTKTSALLGGADAAILTKTSGGKAEIINELIKVPWLDNEESLGSQRSQRRLAESAWAIASPISRRPP